MQQHRLKF